MRTRSGGNRILPADAELRRTVYPMGLPAQRTWRGSGARDTSSACPSDDASFGQIEAGVEMTQGVARLALGVVNAYLVGEAGSLGTGRRRNAGERRKDTRRGAEAVRAGSEARSHRTHPRPRRPLRLRGGALRLVGRARLRPPLGISLPYRPICLPAAGPNGRRFVRPPEPLYAQEDHRPRRGAGSRVASGWSSAGPARLEVDPHAGAHARPRLPFPP
jgi:hypothetical protein